MSLPGILHGISGGSIYLMSVFRGIAAAVSGTSVSAGDVSGADVSAADVSGSDSVQAVLTLLDSLHIQKRVVIFLSILLFAALIVLFELLRSKYVLTVTRRTVVLKNLPRVFDGTKLIVLSDLHQMRFGERNEELAKRIKREEPDYILFTGDMGDCGSFNVDAFYDLLESLGDGIPFIMSPGNEDLKLGGGRVHRNFLKEVERSGAVMLNNACAEMTYEGEKIYIYGFAQPLEPQKNVPVKLWENAPIAENDVLALLGKCPKDAPVILLAHDPRPFPSFRKWGATLVLSGHVQGGIIRLPLIGGLIGPSGELRPRYSGGLYEYSGSKLFVTRGLGSSGKIQRFLNAPEIAVLTLMSRNTAKSNRISEHESIRSTLNRSVGDIRSQLSSAGDFAKSEAHSIRDLLDERLTQLRDFIDLLIGKKRSRFAIEADEKKKRNTFIAPNKRKKPGSRTAPRHTDTGQRPSGGSGQRTAGSGGQRPAGGGGLRTAGSGGQRPAGGGGLRTAGSGGQRTSGSGGQRPAGSGGQRPAGGGGQRTSGSSGQRPAGSGGQRPAGSGGQRPAGSGGQRPAGGGQRTSGSGGQRPAGGSGGKAAGKQGQRPSGASGKRPGQQ